MNNLLENKTAVVTGGSRGIGKCIVESFSAEGAQVLTCARNSENIELPAGVHWLQVDVGHSAEIDALAEYALNVLGRIDILVNNAGHDIGGRRLFHEGTSQGWSAIIETNVIGLMRVTQAVLEGMVRRDSGHIVNIGSIAGVQTSPLCAVYSASKHAVHGFSETLRLDYGNTGIKISEVLPGMVKTEFAATRFDDEDRGAKYYEDFGICLEPEDIARSVMFVLDQPTDVVIAQVLVLPTSRTK